MGGREEQILLAINALASAVHAHLEGRDEDADGIVSAVVDHLYDLGLRVKLGPEGDDEGTPVLDLSEDDPLAGMDDATKVSAVLALEVLMVLDAKGIPRDRVSVWASADVEDAEITAIVLDAVKEALAWHQEP